MGRSIFTLVTYLSGNMQREQPPRIGHQTLFPVDGCCQLIWWLCPVEVRGRLLYFLSPNTVRTKRQEGMHFPEQPVSLTETDAVGTYCPWQINSFPCAPL